MSPIITFKKLIIMLAFVSGAVLLFLCANTEIQSLAHISGRVTPQKIPIEVKNIICAVNHEDRRTNVVNKEDQQMIYFVTPTYPRPEQVPELIRLGHTLMHVPRLHWIVADDQPVCSKPVTDILRQSGLPFTHISSPKPFIYTVGHFPRGVSNRRAALSWIRKNVKDGILYFGDDDNTFDLQLFDEIRQTKKVSMFPVGLIGGYGVSSPVVKDGKVAGFFDSWPATRKFAVDMAGFAINIGFLKPSANMPFVEGYEEDLFLLSLDLKLDDIEPLADNCSKIFVWHTRTAKTKKPIIKFSTDKLNNLTYIPGFVNLIKEIVKTGLASLTPEKGKYPKILRDHKIYDPLEGF